MLYRPFDLLGAPAINARSAQARDLVACWPSLVPNQTTTDLVRRHAAVTGSVVMTDRANPFVGRAPGFIGAAADANGYYTMPSDALASLDTEATLSCWCKLQEATPADGANTGIPVYIGSGSSDPSVYPFTDGTAYIATFLATRISFTPLASVDRAQWHLFTITSKPGANNWICYQNAQVATTQTGDATVSKATGKIGTSHIAVGSFFVRGFVADVRVYKRALTAAEVTALYAPASRWELYEVRKRPIRDVPAEGGGVSLDQWFRQASANVRGSARMVPSGVTGIKAAA